MSKKNISTFRSWLYSKLDLLGEKPGKSLSVSGVRWELGSHGGEIGIVAGS
jgi:hypothetical protein